MTPFLQDSFRIHVQQLPQDIIYLLRVIRNTPPDLQRLAIATSSQRLQHDLAAQGLIDANNSLTLLGRAACATLDPLSDQERNDLRKRADAALSDK